MAKITFPVTGHTRIGFWGIEQYTQSGMWWFTLVFGLLGLHHLLFRSPHTWILFLIFNTLTFGYWWLFDLIQLSEGGGIDLNTYGLETPWGPAGIAQGMFKNYTFKPYVNAPPAPGPIILGRPPGQAASVTVPSAPPMPPLAPPAPPAPLRRSDV